MAIACGFDTGMGIQATYWKICAYHYDIVTSTVSVSIRGYLSEAARLANINGSILNWTFTYTTEQLGGEPTLANIYAQIMAEESWSGATKIEPVTGP